MFLFSKLEWWDKYDCDAEGIKLNTDPYKDIFYFIFIWQPLWRTVANHVIMQIRFDNSDLFLTKYIIIKLTFC